jgi:hypothetical protein
LLPFALGESVSIIFAKEALLRLFIAINDMPVSDKIKQECKRSERNTMLPYAAVTFAFWQGAKFYEFDRILTVLGILLILHVASMHMTGIKNRPTVAIASIISLSVSALSAYLFSDKVFFLVGVFATGFVIFLASNLRRRQVVRDFSAGLRNWPD